MSEIRNVNEALKLVANLDDGSKYVRAYLWDNGGNPLSPPTVDLSHIGDGIFTDTTVLMPNKAQVIAKFKVYDDAAYSVLNDCEYDFPSETFELSKFDPALIQPVNAAVFGVIETENIEGRVYQEDVVLGELEAESIESESIEEQSVEGQIEQTDNIEGVLYD